MNTIFLLVLLVVKLDDHADGIVNPKMMYTMEDCIREGEAHKLHWSQVPYEPTIFYDYRCIEWEVKK